MMTTKDIFNAFKRLSADIKSNINTDYQDIILKAQNNNSWFEKQMTQKAILNLCFIIDSMPELLFQPQNKNILIICAGNIPAVAFHDILCVLLTGNKAIIKLSSNDNIIIPFLLHRLTSFFPELQSHITILETTFTANGTSYDAVIATGSNSTALLFESYFKDIPHLIRKSRTSIAVIQPQDDISGIEDDICLYFSQGCRNVSHLFVPTNYDFTELIHRINAKYSYFAEHTKYRNNLDYQKAILIMNNIPFIDANSILLRQNDDIFSPIGVVHYSFYENIESVYRIIQQNKDNLQCVVANQIAFCVQFGTTQRPSFTDYADNINTLQWLYSLFRV